MAKTMNDNKILLTQSGLDALKAELKQLEQEKRPAIVDRLAKAREEGDLSENSNYQQSREELAFVDGRIEELQTVLEHAEVMEVSNGDCSQVALGCKVKLKANGNDHIFHLVGEWEADPAEKKISHRSPLGQALMGRELGAKVEVEAPAGKIVYEIVEIE